MGFMKGPGSAGIHPFAQMICSMMFQVPDKELQKRLAGFRFIWFLDSGSTALSAELVGKGF